jgi:hypothetical protein
MQYYSLSIGVLNIPKIDPFFRFQGKKLQEMMKLYYVTLSIQIEKMMSNAEMKKMKYRIQIFVKFHKKTALIYF